MKSAWNSRQAASAVQRLVLYHNMTRDRPVLNMWNEFGTNCGRIGDSTDVRVRSPRHMALACRHNTRSGSLRDSDAQTSGAIVNLRRKCDSAISQEQSSCGLWGLEHRPRVWGPDCGDTRLQIRAAAPVPGLPAACDTAAIAAAVAALLTALSRRYWRGPAAPPTRIASPAARRSRSASASKSGTAPGPACPGSARNTPPRRAARRDI